ncbi:signal peptidase I [Actinomycetospora chiangmaiensis]|uniref:signal peptidase I n=1 Tax=Actinomycetospora chiangmaiensis TaxID=402650 RepID=UPI0003828EA4|nr:signal peptidase I [Actinomycetospora chiangmaiensis]
MPPTDEPGRRYREPRHGGTDPRWGGPGEAAPTDDAYGDVGDRWSAGRHGQAPPHDEDRFGPAAGRHGAPDPDPLGGRRPAAEWPPPTALPSGPPRDARRGPAPLPPRYGQAPLSPPYGQAPPSPPYGQAPPVSPYGQAPPSPPYGQAPPSPPHGYGPPNGRPAGPPSNGHGPLPTTGEQWAGRPAPTAVQPSAEAAAAPPQRDVPLLAGGTPPPSKVVDPDDGSDVTQTTGLGPDTGKHKHRRGAAADTQVDGAAVGDDERPAGRRRGAASGPGRVDDDAGSAGPGRRARSKDGAAAATPGGKRKRKGSFWRELPLLVVVAIVLTFVIQTFIARIYVIPSASMEQTLHGCTGCANDRVAVDKVSYRFTDPAPGDVVVFKGPPAWLDNDEVGDNQPSGNPIVRGFQEALSLVGLAAPNEKDFVKRVIAVGGQTVQCCDAQNRVLVDGQPLTEPYLYYQSGLGDRQAAFDPVQVPQGQLWVMGDNRNNSADARFHGPVPLDDVIGKVRVVVLPITRWRTVPAIDPQQQAATALAPPSGTGGPPEGTPEVAGALLAVPVVWGGRRLRRAVAEATTGAPPDPSRRPEGPARE